MFVWQMPHESTVAHEQRFVMESPMISRSRTFSVIDDEDSPDSHVNHHKVISVISKIGEKGAAQSFYQL